MTYSREDWYKVPKRTPFALGKASKT